MNNSEIARRLGSLMLLDFDAAHAYEEAIENLKPADIREQFTRFRIDHQNQVFNLSVLIKKRGEEPPQHSNDFNKYSTADIKSPILTKETKEIIDVLYRNAKLIGDRYGDMMKLGFTSDIMEVIRSGLSRQERHIAYLESLLALSPLGR